MSADQVQLKINCVMDPVVLWQVNGHGKEILTFSSDSDLPKCYTEMGEVTRTAITRILIQL